MLATGEGGIPGAQPRAGSPWRGPCVPQAVPAWQRTQQVSTARVMLRCVGSKQQGTHTRMPTCIIPADSQQQSAPSHSSRQSATVSTSPPAAVLCMCQPDVPTRSPPSAVVGLHTCCGSPSNLSRSRPATPSSPHVTPRGASSPSLVWRQQAAAQLSNEYQSYPFGEDALKTSSFSE